MLSGDHCSSGLGDIVLHLLTHLKDAQTTKARRIFVKGQSRVHTVVFLVRGNQVFAQYAGHQPQLRGRVDAAVHIVAPVVSAIGIVGLFVVLVLIDPEIVVHIYSEQKLWPVDAKAQKGLFVVGDDIGLDQVVVLIEVGYKVVVLVPAREDLRIARLPVGANRVGEAILVVVVFDQFDDALALALVVDLARSQGDKSAGIVEGVHAVDLAKHEKRVGALGHVHHPRWCIAPSLDPRRGPVRLCKGVGVLAVIPVQIVLGVQVKPRHID